MTQRIDNIDDDDLISGYYAGLSSKLLGERFGINDRTIRSRWSRLIKAGLLKPRTQITPRLRLSPNNDLLLQRLKAVHGVK